jgi:hypothetical protein
MLLETLFVLKLSTGKRGFVMKAKFTLILLAVCMISGGVATLGQRIYPIQGPLAAQMPPLVFTAQTKKGEFVEQMSLTLSNGEAFKGNIAFMHASFLNSKKPGTPASYPPQPNLAFAWDAVYGQGYYVAHVLGKRIGQKVFTGNRGTVLQVEFLDGKFGVAVDNKGNVFKIAF